MFFVATAEARFPAMAGTRQICDLTIDAVWTPCGRTSCGTGVPHMAFGADRVDTELMPYFDTLGADGVARFWARKNVETIDGYPTGLFED
ncbi:MAG TPA: hypothetical protein EYP31_10330 [Roseibacterium sp.]|nr:hypothetical protein [Roseibacterium sp.]